MDEYNGFNQISIKDKLKEIWYKYKKYIIISVCLIIILIVALSIIFKQDRIDNTNLKYQSIETVMKLNAEKFVKNNNVTKDMYLSLNNLNLKIDNELDCSSISGVLKEKNNYYPYLVCKGYNSSVIKEVLDNNESNKQYGTLKGDNPYILTSGEYQEPGYDIGSKYTVNIKENDIENGINIISYYILDNNQYVAELKRIVIAEDIKGNEPVIELTGNKTRTIPQNSLYKELGFTATDKLDGDLTDKVEVSGIVDTSKPGIYTITYQVTNSRNKTTTTKRTIIVNQTEVTLDITHTINPTTVTSNGVTITLDIKGEGYNKTITPTNEEVTVRNPSITVYKNGLYEFVIYDKNDNSEVYEVNVINADNTAPALTCSGTIGNGQTTITITSNEKIAYYTYNDEKSTDNKKTFNSEEKKITVNGYDESNNKGTVICEIGVNMYYEEASKPINGTIIASDTSDSLKVEVIKTKAYGYISYIWAKNPYQQFNKGTSDWGTNVMSPLNIVNKQVQQKSLQSKIIIAVNGSGFYKAGSWAPTCKDKSYLPKYYSTTEGPLVITDGQVVRNWYYDGAIDQQRNHSIYGITPNSELVAYPRINSYTEAERKELFQKIIDSGIRNTFCFRPTIMLNGEATSDYDTSPFNAKGSRQVMCQRNTNNFAFLTIPSVLSKNEKIAFFKKLGCKTTINLDGGGSLGIVFKPKTGTAKVIYGGSRQIVDVAYFTEL